MGLLVFGLVSEVAGGVFGYRSAYVLAVVFVEELFLVEFALISVLFAFILSNVAFIVVLVAVVMFKVLEVFELLVVVFKFVVVFIVMFFVVLVFEVKLVTDAFVVLNLISVTLSIQGPMTPFRELLKLYYGKKQIAFIVVETVNVAFAVEKLSGFNVFMAANFILFTETVIILYVICNGFTISNFSEYF